MRIHRTTQTRAFSTFANALLRDRSISWWAAGVLLYVLSLPENARATIRSLAEQRKEGRARIGAALRELEESRYLRREVRKDRETGQLFTTYEVFDTPYDEAAPEGGEDGGEKVRNPAWRIAHAVHLSRPAPDWPDGRPVLTTSPDLYADMPLVRTIRLLRQR